MHETLDAPHFERATVVRYLYTIVRSLPLFIGIAVWGALGLTPIWLTVSVVASAIAGVAVGALFIVKMNGFLFEGKTPAFSGKNRPYGCILMTVLTVLGAVALAIAWAVDPLIVRTGAIVFGIVPAVGFGMTGAWVWRLEKRHDDEVIMTSFGFMFLSDIQRDDNDLECGRNRRNGE